MRFTIIMFVVITLVVAAVPNLVFVVSRSVAWLRGRQLGYGWFGYATLAMTALWVMMFVYGMVWGRFECKVTQVTYRNEAIPAAFEGYTIVQISDLHLDGWRGHEELLKERVATINGIDADLICFTGDLVSLSRAELHGFEEILGGLKAKDGVVAVMGNHDYLPYDGLPPLRSPRSKAKEIEILQRDITDRLGWRLLLNENVIIRRGNDSIAVIGCENQSMGVHSIIRRGNLKKAATGTEGMFRILLTHDPTHWRGEVLGKTDIHLTLSGHTHGMQVKLFGLSQGPLIYSEYEGLYSEGGQSLYVNIGLGATMPMRIGATPEITVMRLIRL